MDPDRSTPVRRQRLAAYTLLMRTDELLLTQLAASTTAAGRWTLPGGGVDHGKDPRDTVVREAYEETGLHVRVGALLGSMSVHFEGTSPSGVCEDFHAVRLVFAGSVPAGAPQPRVIERGGTTVAARWQPIDDVTSGALESVDLVPAGLQMLSCLTDRWRETARSYGIALPRDHDEMPT